MQLIEGEWGAPKVRCPECAEGSINESQITEDDARVARINSERSVIVQPTMIVHADKLPFDGKAAAAADNQ